MRAPLAALLPLLLPAPTSADIVRFVKGPVHSLHLAEVKVYGSDLTTELTPLAYEFEKGYHGQYDHTRCFDGNTNNFCHSSGTEPENALWAEYAANTVIGRIKIWNRGSSTVAWAKANDVVVQVLPCHGGAVLWDTTLSGSQATFTFDVPAYVPATCTETQTTSTQTTGTRTTSTTATTATATSTMTTVTATTATSITTVTTTVTQTTTTVTSSTTTSRTSITSSSSTTLSTVSKTTSSSTSTSTGSSSTTSTTSSTTTSSSTTTFTSFTTSGSSTSSSSSSSSTSTSTSSTTSSSSSTTTSSSSSTTSTTTLTDPQIDSFHELQAFTRFHELDLISKLSVGNVVNYTKAFPGAVMAGARFRVTREELGNSNAPSRNVTLPVTGGASVTVPLEAVMRRANLTDAVLVAALLDPTWPPRAKDGDGRPVEVHSLMNVNLFSLEGEEQVVDGLEEKITLTMPVNHTENNPLSPLPECGFFHEDSGAWRDLPSSLTWGHLTCSTSHLTFFASLLKGFLSALLCSQLELFSAQGMGRLFKGDWHSSPVAGVFWLFEACLGLLMLAAFVADRRRGPWDDRAYLVPASEACDLEERPSQAMATLQGCGESCRETCTDCSVCKDVAEEIISKWAQWLTKCRALFEGLFEGGGGGGGGTEGPAHRIADALVLQSARSQVGFSLGVSNDTLDFLTSDADFGSLVLDADPASAPGPWRPRLEAWQDLHAEVIAKTGVHWYDHSWKGLPLVALRILVVSNPVVSLLLFDCFVPSAMRALLLCAELLGAAMTACLFFAGTGSATSALNGAECTEPKDIWEELGQIVAVATVSLVLGGIPVAVIGSLHSRQFKQMDFEGSPKWMHQLKTWRTQDMMFWVFGTGYVACCSFVIMLFLANVSVEDLPEWGVASGTTVLEDMVIVPALVAACMPVLTMLALTAVSSFAGRQHQAHLQCRMEKLEGGQGNWVPRSPQSPPANQEEDSSRVSV